MEKLFCSTEYGKGLLLIGVPAEVVAAYKNGYKAQKNRALMKLRGLHCSVRETEKCKVVDFSGSSHVVEAWQFGRDRKAADVERYNSAPMKWRVSSTNGKGWQVALAFFPT